MGGPVKISRTAVKGQIEEQHQILDIGPEGAFQLTKALPKQTVLQGGILI